MAEITPEDYQTAKKTALDFLEFHVSEMRAEKDKTPGITAIMSDFRGTLNESKALDDFLCHAFDAGLPVFILSATEKEDIQAFPDRAIIGRLMDSGNPWLIEKPYAGWDSYRPGMYWDDDIILTWDSITGVSAVVGSGQRFLQAWESLSDEDKKEALQPWVDFHQELSREKGVAPVVAEGPMPG